MLNQNIYICLATLIGCCHGYYTKLLHVNVNVCMHVGCVFSLVTPFVHPVVCMLPRQGPVEHLCVCTCVCVCTGVCTGVCTCMCVHACVRNMCNLLPYRCSTGYYKKQCHISEHTVCA